LRMILSDLPSPAEAGFAKAGNRSPLFGIMRSQKRHRRVFPAMAASTRTILTK
jgi:hypothetical protein